MHFASLIISFWVFTILYLHSLSPFWQRCEFLYAIFFFSELAYSFAIVNHLALLQLLISFSWLLCIVLTTLVTWFPMLCVVSAFFNFYLNTTVLFYAFLFRFSQKKPSFSLGWICFWSGERGIRTRGCFHIAGFQDQSHQPLDHLSIRLILSSCLWVLILLFLVFILNSFL